MRESSTPRRQPINRRQFSARVRGISQRLMSPLHMSFTSFCSIGLISFLPPAPLCYLPPFVFSQHSLCLCSSIVFVHISKLVCMRLQSKDSSVQRFLTQPEFLRTSWKLCSHFLVERKLKNRPAETCNSVCIAN